MSPEKSGPKALVFGASGYIGSNLVPFLREAGWTAAIASRAENQRATAVQQ